MRVTAEIPQREMSKLVRNAKFWQAGKLKAIHKLIEETTEAIYNDVVANAPVDEGDLKKSIKQSLEKGLKPYGIVSVGAFYSKFIEFGTEKMLASPFVKPAFDRHVPVFIAKLKML